MRLFQGFTFVKNIGKKTLRQALIFTSALLIPIYYAHAAIPEELVPAYSNAVILYNQKKYDEAVEQLDELSKRDPSVPEFLELKALVFKGSAKKDEALATYSQLIELRKKLGAHSKELSPYHYERGLIEYQSSNFAQAHDDLEFARSHGFNVIAASFFLGLINYQAKDFSAAETSLILVANGDIDELKPMANYYLGQTFLSAGDASSAGAKLVIARQQAELFLSQASHGGGDLSSAQQTLKMTEEALATLDHHGFFGSVGLTTSEDTNVLSVPSTVSLTNSTGGASGKNSVKEIVQASAGYMTSALKAWQWIPSYHGSFNYNFNQDTKTGEFATHNFSLYLNHDVLAKLNWGVHVDAQYIQQDQYGDDGNASLGSYSLTVPMGAYVRYQVSPTWSIKGSVDYSSEKYYLDPTLAQYLARSGWDVAPRFDLTYTSGRLLWNPSGSLIGDFNNTNGSEYTSKSVTMEFVNVAHLADKWDARGAVDYGTAFFTSRPEGNRFDHIITLDGNVLYHFKPHWNAFADVQYIDNLSTVPEIYQFNRFIASLGVTYSF
jgi:tetratricopeptide (TPR) repeat protein